MDSMKQSHAETVIENEQRKLFALLAEWLQTPEGESAINASIKHSSEIIAKQNKALQVSPVLLHIPMSDFPK